MNAVVVVRVAGCAGDGVVAAAVVGDAVAVPRAVESGAESVWDTIAKIVGGGVAGGERCQDQLKIS